MRALPKETLFYEINEALEKGVAEAKKMIINSTTVQPLCDILVHTGEVYAGHIGKAICEVFMKYTENVNDGT